MSTESESAPTLRRRALALILATALMLGSYLMFIWALAAASGDETAFAGGLIGIGLGLMPAVFAVAAFVSQHPRSLLATAQACALWIVVMIPVGILSVPVALVTAYGAGGIFAFWLRPGDSRKNRAIAVVVCGFYTGALLAVWPQAGLFASAPLPFAAIALADFLNERQVREA